jgi:hypothetical protein
MQKVKQLADVREPQKFVNVINRSLGIDGLLLDTDELESESIRKFSDLKQLNQELKYSKFICAEPVTDGSGSEEAKGLILYFMLENGLQRAIYIYPSDIEADKLYTELYK